MVLSVLILFWSFFGFQSLHASQAKSVVSDSQLSATITTPEDKQIFLDIFINDKKKGEVIEILQQEHNVWLIKKFAEKLQLSNISNLKVKNYTGDDYVLLPASYEPQINLDDFSLRLKIPPEDFVLSGINSVKTLQHTPSIFSLIWNYIAAFSHEPNFNKAAFYSHHHSLVTMPRGYFSNSLRVDKESNKSLNVVRLESSYTLDWPKYGIITTFGDSASDAPWWSSHVALAGVKIQKSSVFNQGSLTYPTIELISALEKDSTVEVILNKSLLFKKDFPMGRFLLDDLKLPPGFNKGELLVRDQNGVVSTTPFSYFADPEMLRPGVNRFSYSFGSIRNHYLEKSFSYGGPFLGLNHTVGISNFFTLGLHSQLSQEIIGGGIQPRFRLWDFASTAFSLGYTVHDGRHGYAAGNETGLTIPFFSIRFKNIYFSQGYQPQNTNPINSDIGSFMSSTTARIKWFFLSFTSFNFTYAKKNGFENSLLSVNQSLPVVKNLNAFANASYEFSRENFSCFILLSYFFGGGHSMNTSYDQETTSEESLYNINSNYRYYSDPKKKYRYYASANVGTNLENNLKGEANFALYNPYMEGLATIKGDSKSSFSYNTALSSAVIFAKKKVFISKPIENSFSLIHVPARPGLRVYRDHSLFLGETGTDGYFIVTDLHPYQKTSVNFDVREVDPSIDTRNLEKGAVIYPGLNTAHDLSFEAQSIIRLVFRPLKAGKPLEFGTPIFIKDYSENAIVGYDGSVYVEISNNLTKIEGWNGDKSCSFKINFSNKTSEEDYITNLGDIICSKEARN